MAKVNQTQFAQAFIPTSSSRPQQPGVYRHSDQELGFSGGIHMERGWRDLEGALVPKASGAGSPTLTTFRGNLRWFAYANNDDMDSVFHIPHDYAPGTDLHLHLHWSHNGTNISGTSVINYYISYAKGHSQAAFPAQITVTQTLSDLNLTNTPQYTHRIDEFVITSDGGSLTTIDTNLIEPDGLLHIHFDWATIPTITGGAAKPFGFYLDLHYQADRYTTPQKSPDFYRYE
jgi:hypothetical protein